MKGKNTKIGDKYTGARGTVVEVITLQGEIATVKIEGTDIIFDIKRSHVRSGKFRTPLCKTVYGVVYIGNGPYVCRLEDGTMTRSYSVWSNILRRCYTNYKSDEKHKTYVNVEVCDEWMNYQNFAQWYCDKSSRYDGSNIEYHVDKDLLSHNHRGSLYSPETCCLLPRLLNCALQEERSTNNKYHGVNNDGNKFYFTLSKKCKNYVKRFDTETEALDAFNSAKYEYLLELANEYRQFLDHNVYEAIVNWTPRKYKED